MADQEIMHEDLEDGVAASLTGEEHYIPADIGGDPDPNKRYRNWVFYMYSEHATGDCPYSDESISWLNPDSPCPLEFMVASPKTMYLVCQVEMGDDNPDRVHMQGYLQLHNACTKSALLKHFGTRFWFLYRYSTHAEAVAYATKEHTRLRGPWEFGTPKDDANAGHRSDWSTQSESMRSRVISGVQKQSAINAAVREMPHLAPCVRGLVALYDAHAPPPVFERPVQVYYIWGKTSGAGKTTRTKRHFKFNALYLDGSYVEGKSFDEYTNQSVVVFDEWKPSGWPMTLMNGLLDPFCMTLICRYYNKYAQWTTAIILSNRDPAEIYLNNPDRHTFIRRIENHVTRVESWEDPIPYISADEQAGYLLADPNKV